MSARRFVATTLAACAILALSSSPLVAVAAQEVVAGDSGPAVAPLRNGTDPSADDDKQAWVGFIGAAVAAVFFGSNFVPVKKYDVADGVFFQLFLGIGIFIVGVVVNGIQEAPKFHPFAMLGGVLWATGSICVVPIVRAIGMGMGLLIWGGTSLVMGWACGRFGLLGNVESVPANPGLNYGGVVLSLVSIFIFIFVKSEGVVSKKLNADGSPASSSHYDALHPQQRLTIDMESPSEHPTDHTDHVGGGGGAHDEAHSASEDETWIDHLSPGRKRLMGVVLSIFSGVLYGTVRSNLGRAARVRACVRVFAAAAVFFALGVFSSIHVLCFHASPFTHSLPAVRAPAPRPLAGNNFNPPKYVQNHYAGASQQDLDYVFAHFTGIFITCVFFFCVYALSRKNQPKVFPRVALPAMASGVMWAIAQVGFFIANRHLSLAVSFPIVSTCPGVVGALWGVFVFREIRGRRNILILLVAFAVTFAGVIMNALSTA